VAVLGGVVKPEERWSAKDLYGEPRDYGITAEQAAARVAELRAAYIADLVVDGSETGIHLAAGRCPCGTHPLTECHYCGAPVGYEESVGSLTDWVDCGECHDEDGAFIGAR